MLGTCKAAVHGEQSQLCQPTIQAHDFAAADDGTPLAML
jgi:hypothetical protein